MTPNPSRRRPDRSRPVRRAAVLLAALTALLVQLPAPAPAQSGAPLAPARPCAADPAESPQACSGQPLDARGSSLHVVTGRLQLPTGRVGRPYKATRLVAGGAQRYSGVVIGDLPDGMRVLDNGYLAGTPAQAGVFRFGVRIQDSATPPQQISQTYELRVHGRPVPPRPRPRPRPRPGPVPPPPDPPHEEPVRAPSDHLAGAFTIYALTGKDVEALAAATQPLPKPTISVASLAAKASGAVKSALSTATTTAAGAPPAEPAKPAPLYPGVKTWTAPMLDVEYPSRALFQAALEHHRRPFLKPGLKAGANAPVIDMARRQVPYAGARAPNWAEQPGCTCTPPALGPAAKTIYGFFPFWRSAKPPPGIVFNRVNRIGLVGVQLMDSGQWLRPGVGPDEWWAGTSEFALRAQVRGARLDLVLQRGDWRSFEQMTGDQRVEVARTAAQRAMVLVDTPLDDRGLRSLLLPFWHEPTHVFDGVTLMFDHPDHPRERAAFHDFYSAFVPALIQEMQKRKRAYSLNIVGPDMLSLPIERNREEQAYLWKTFLDAKKAAEPAARHPDLPEAERKRYVGKTEIAVRMLAPVREGTSTQKKILRGNIDKVEGIHGNDRVAVLQSVLPILYLPASQTWDGKPGTHAVSGTQQGQVRDDLIYARQNFGGVGLWSMPVKGHGVDEDVYDQLQQVFFAGQKTWTALCSLTLRLAWQASVILLAIASIAYFFWGRFSGRWKLYRYLLLGLLALTTVLSFVLLFLDAATVKLREGNVPFIVFSAVFLAGTTWFFLKPKVPRP